MQSRQRLSTRAVLIILALMVPPFQNCAGNFESGSGGSVADVGSQSETPNTPPETQPPPPPEPGTPPSNPPPAPPPPTPISQLKYSVIVNDPQNLLAADRAGVLANFDAAMVEWGEYIYGNATISVRLDVVSNSSTGRFSGGSETTVFIKKQGIYNIFEPISSYKLRTGQDPNGAKPEVIIEIQPNFMRQNYWIDPNPMQRTLPVPARKIDLVTVFAHEFGHALGMTGFINTRTGALPADRGITPYDALIDFTNQQAPIFRGASATAVYGSPPPVFFTPTLVNTSLNHNGRLYSAQLNPSQNIYHVGRFSAAPESDLSFFSLMAGSWQAPTASSTVGWRIFINELDVAVMRDIGVPTP